MENIINFLKKNWYYIAAVVLVIVVIVIIRRRRANGEEESGSGLLLGAEDINATFPLQPYSVAKTYSSAKGSKGNQIKKLQSIYNKQNSSATPLDVDGKYGPESEGAFIGFFGDMINPNGVITEAQYNAIMAKYN